MFQYAFSSIFGLLSFCLALYCIIDVVGKDRPRKALWIIALLLIPFASIIYLVLKFSFRDESASVNSQQQQQPQVIQQNIPRPVYPESTHWQNTLEPGQGEQNPSGQMFKPELTPSQQAFRVAGTILGTIALVSGILFVGFFIFLYLALASYGSNK
jgi:hypothetical protein